MMTSNQYDKSLERSRYKTRLKRIRAFCSTCGVSWAYPELINNTCLRCGTRLNTLPMGTPSHKTTKFLSSV